MIEIEISLLQYIFSDLRLVGFDSKLLKPSKKTIHSIENWKIGTKFSQNREKIQFCKSHEFFGV